MKKIKKILLRDIINLCQNVKIAVDLDPYHDTQPGLNLVPIFESDCHEEDDLFCDEDILTLYLDYEVVDILVHDEFTINIIIIGDIVEKDWRYDAYDVLL